MGRNPTPRKRLGHLEARELTRLTKIVKSFKIFGRHKSKGETVQNSWLINYLNQNDVLVENVNIHPATFVGETFRPECCLRGTGKYPICAIECKKLTDKYAKARWKEGLSQAMLYKHHYKAVLYVLYDYTKGGVYAKAFGRGNRTENQFAKQLREDFGVEIIAIRPQ